MSDASPRGLTAAEVAAARGRFGPNVLPTAATTPVLRQLLSQFVHFFALMLWVAAGLSFVARLPELGAAIIVVILANGTFAFVQEHRAEQAAALLQALVPRRATVRRDGEMLEIDAADLVPGDLVLVTAGDRISADGPALEAAGLLVDRSTMTGESVPELVAVGDTLEAGTFVAEGEATMVVRATGGATRLAGIATLTQSIERQPTPLARELHRVVCTIATIAVGVGGAFFLLSFLLDISRHEAFVFAVGVTVALVPEGLLPTVTLSLAIAARRMAERQALVRRLESVETLGSTTFICTDKTGTLTRNEMAVVQVWTPAGEIRLDGEGYAPLAAVTGEVGDTHRALAAAARTCSRGRVVRSDDGFVARGDPMEAALDALATRLGAEEARAVERWFPFDPHRRRMSALVDGELLTKGAPEAVLDVCRGDTTEARRMTDELTAGGRRVLAVARRTLPSTAGDEPGEPGEPSASTLEAELELLGLVAMEDPPRPHAADAVARCHAAGIRLALITGDHPATARSIAQQVGFPDDGGRLLLGPELPDDDQVLGALVDRDGVIVARASPEDKVRIAAALRARGHVVAMTGDGVNDGPALREADVGIAMGRSGTDIAREAADLVLLDDDFATIVEAVAQGRSVDRNIKRFLTYHLTDNVAELTPFVVWVMSGGQIPLALGVLQILALDLGTDTLSAVALGAEPPEAAALSGSPSKGRLLDRTVARRAFGVLGATEAVVEMAAFFTTLLVAGWRPGDPAPEGHLLAVAAGAAFAAVVLGQAANAFACRSETHPPRWATIATNRLLVWAVLGALAMGLVFLAVAPVADLLDHRWPTAAGWTVAAATPLMVLAANRLDLWWNGRRISGAGAGAG